MVGERLLERAARVLDHLAVDLLRTGALEQRDRRQLPRRALGGGAEGDLDDERRQGERVEETAEQLDEEAQDAPSADTR